MKKKLKSLTVALLASITFSLVACGQPSKDEIQTYTVTFSQEGFADMQYKVEAGASLTELPPTKVMTGYTVNWEEKDLINIQSNVVVNAIITPNEYQITYLLSEENGESMVGETVQTVTYDAEYTLQTPDKYAYSFVGWKSKETLIPQSGVWKQATDVTLSATWVENFYKITFIQDGNSVEKIIENGDILSVEDVPELKDEPGYDITWSVTDFSEIKTNTVVTPNKKAKNYTVQYLLEEDESIDGDSEESVTFNEPYQLKQPTRAGYTFTGWEWDSDDGKKIFSAEPQNAWLIASDVDLKATWTANKNVITFIHVDNTSEQIEFKTGETITEIPTPKALDGYDVRWSVTDFSEITESITVTAIPTPKNYNVTYYVEGDSVVNGIQTQVTYNAEYQLAQPTPRYGYTFDYWLTESGEALPTTGTWKLLGDQKLTAVWANNYFTITFVHIDGSQEIRIVEKGDRLSIAPTCKGKVGNTVSWNISDVTSISQDQTVYAIAVPKEYRVTYTLGKNESLNNGVKMEFVIKYGESYTLTTPNNTNEEKVFAGWVNADTGKAIPYSGIWKYDQNMTLKATWAKEWTNNY